MCSKKKQNLYHFTSLPPQKKLLNSFWSGTSWRGVADAAAATSNIFAINFLGNEKLASNSNRNSKLQRAGSQSVTRFIAAQTFLAFDFLSVRVRVRQHEPGKESAGSETCCAFWLLTADAAVDCRLLTAYFAGRIIEMLVSLGRCRCHCKLHFGCTKLTHILLNKICSSNFYFGTALLLCCRCLNFHLLRFDEEGMQNLFKVFYEW